MFVTIIDFLKTALSAVFGWTVDIFDAVGATGFVIGLSIAGLFLSFVMLNHIGLLTKVGKSDRVTNVAKSKRVTKVRGDKRV